MALVSIPLEDELGDVLDKALQCAGLTVEALAERAGVGAARIQDAIDYRSDLTSAELRRLAAALGLNEVGLCALAAGRYPRPQVGRIPFEVWPLRMAHGIGVANAYVVAETGAERGLLFDTGSCLAALEREWPASIRGVDAIFLTHVETEHAGGLCGVVAHFGAQAAFIPQGAEAPCGRPIGEGETKLFGNLEVAAFATPGHTPAHNCYRVSLRPFGSGPDLLLSGDLVFAGSAGGGYASTALVRMHLCRILGGLPPETVIAPGHGPMTTVGNELSFNPFAV